MAIKVNSSTSRLDFSYRAVSWKRPRRVIAKVEWHLGELFPRIGFVVTNMTFLT